MLRIRRENLLKLVNDQNFRWVRNPAAFFSISIQDRSANGGRRPQHPPLPGVSKIHLNRDRRVGRISTMLVDAGQEAEDMDIHGGSHLGRQIARDATNWQDDKIFILLELRNQSRLHRSTFPRARLSIEEDQPLGTNTGQQLSASRHDRRTIPLSQGKGARTNVRIGKRKFSHRGHILQWLIGIPVGTVNG